MKALLGVTNGGVPQVTYTEAKQQLDKVLRQPAFHYHPAEMPWYVRIWRWIASRVHLLFPFHAAGSVADVVLAVIACALLAAVALWGTLRWRERSWRLVDREHLVNKSEEIWKQIHSSMSAGKWELAVHWLMIAAIQEAVSRQWLLDNQSKTARRCLREVRRNADSEFADLFEELVATAELALFARQPIDRAAVRRMCAGLETRLRKGVG